MTFLKKQKFTLNKINIFLISIIILLNIFISLLYNKNAYKNISELNNMLIKKEEENNMLDEISDNYMKSDLLHQCELIHTQLRIFINTNLSKFSELCRLEYNNYTTKKYLEIHMKL